MTWTLPGFSVRHKTAAFLLFWLAACSGIVLAASQGLRSPVQLPWSSADRSIPFVGWFVYVYYSHFLFVPFAYFSLKEERSLNTTLWTMGASTVIALPLFYFYPLVIPKPYFSDPGFPAAVLYRILHVSSAPLSNCFPSLHAAYALAAALPFLRERRRRFPAMILWAGAICASTVLAKQHFLADLLAGAALAAGLYVFFSTRTEFSRGR